MCACPHSTTFRIGRWHQPWLAEGLRGTLVTGTRVLLWHEIQNWPKAPAISWWDPGSLVHGGSHTSSCCCLGIILVAALLVLLYQGELLWKSRRAQFPSETTVISVLYVFFIAGGRQHDGCVWFCVWGGEEEHFQLQEARTDCHPWSSKLSFTCGARSSLPILPFSGLTNQITNRKKGSPLWASLWCKIYKVSTLQLP